MAETTIQEQIVREAPEIEAYKLGLLELAKKRAEIPVDIPAMRIAEMTPQQIRALELSGMGVGSYAPYMAAAGQAFTKAAEGYGGLPEYGMAAMETVGKATQEAGSMYRGLPAYGMAGMEAATEYGDLAASLGLAGSQIYDPRSVMAYMNPYQEAVTQRAIEEMGRQAQIQQQDLSARAVKAGAFGGSREGIQRAELGRNLADVQSKRILEDYFANYSQAQTAAMNAFANQQSRTQTAGNLALGSGELGSQGATRAGNLQQAGAAGIGNLGQLGLQGITQAGQFQQASAAGIGTLGQQASALGQLQSGLQQGDVSFLYNIGEKQMQQRQKELDAARQTALQQAYEPFQRVSFAADIYKGAPSSQQTLSQTTAPSPSLVSQAAGLGTAGLAAYNLTKN